VLRRGLPIGKLTSQFWSNGYLNPLDGFVTRELGCRAYVRYVDDFALFADNKWQLGAWRAQISARRALWRYVAWSPRPFTADPPRS
jgi:RNA-directed DNA polymerase